MLKHPVKSFASTANHGRRVLFDKSHLSQVDCSNTQQRRRFRASSRLDRPLDNKIATFEVLLWGLLLPNAVNIDLAKHHQKSFESPASFLAGLSNQPPETSE